jgi:hypothetical protein
MIFGHSWPQTSQPQIKQIFTEVNLLKINLRESVKSPDKVFYPCLSVLVCG